MPLFLPNEDDARILREMVADWKRRQGKTTGRYYEGRPDQDEHQGPEVYIALTPMGGIPALNRQGTSGTGSPLLSMDDVPGYADCEIYRIIRTLGVPSFFKVHLRKTVFNLSTLPIAGNVWISVKRDKYETWLADLALEFEECP